MKSPFAWDGTPETIRVPEAGVPSSLTLNHKPADFPLLEEVAWGFEREKACPQRSNELPHRNQRAINKKGIERPKRRELSP